MIILDSGSTVSLFKSRNLITNAREAEVKIELDTNVGSRIIDEVKEIKGLGTVYFNKNGIANIFSLKELVKHHRVSYNSSKEDAFVVHLDNKILKFCANEQYVHKFQKVYLDGVKKNNNMKIGVQFLQSVKKRIARCTKREVSRADRARKIYYIVGAPTVENMKMVIRQNLFKNCPVTIQDVNLAEKIFGPDVSTMKGRSTKPSPI